MVVKARNAHPQLARDLLDLERLVVVLAQTPNRPRDAARVSPRRSHEVAEARALSPSQQPVDDLPLDERRKYPLLAGLIDKPDEPDDRVEQVCVYGVNSYRL